MRTFKELQDDTLAWMADSADTGLMRQLAQNAIQEHHSQILKEDSYDFMLWPKTETLSIVSGTSQYALHPRFDQPLFFYEPTTDSYLEEIAAKGLLESGEDWQDGTPSTLDRFMLGGMSKLKKQPSTAGVVVVTTTGGTEAEVNSIVISGVNSAGDVVEETLSAGAPWSTLTGTISFSVIDDITKVGSSWARTITITRGSDTLLELNAAEFGRQYRMFETLGTPAASSSILYRFYKKPRRLTRDNDIPDLPESYDDILVLRALLALQGYSRATPEEITHWRSRLVMLEQSLKMRFQQTRAIGGRPTYTRYISRG